jgi:hypothetical protein
MRKTDETQHGATVYLAADGERYFAKDMGNTWTIYRCHKDVNVACGSTGKLRAPNAYEAITRWYAISVKGKKRSAGYVSPSYRESIDETD